jgi:hypothetical protein
VPAIAQSHFHAHGRHSDLSFCAERIAQLRPQPSCQRGRGLRPPWSTALNYRDCYLIALEFLDGEEFYTGIFSISNCPVD